MCQYQVPSITSGFLHELYPIFCGYEICKKGHSYGPAVRDYFLVHCVLSGKGTFEANGKTYNLEENDCFFIRPNEVTFYKADSSDPWTYLWLAFNGENAALFVKRVGLDKTPVFKNIKVSELFKKLFGMLKDEKFSGPENEFLMSSCLYSFFAAFPIKIAEKTQSEIYVKKVRSYVDNMVSTHISIEKLAAFCKLDRHYLCRIFKKQMGLSLQQYVIERKMQHAEVLLLHTALNVGSVARSVGYSDTYNFSKMFKKYFGVSPKNFRSAKKNT